MSAIYDVLLGKLRTDKMAQKTVGTLISASASKTTPVDADNVAISDSAASNILKRVTWANIKATLKAYFDTLYTGSGTCLVKANNLSDLTNAGTARTNLGLGGIATINDAPADFKTYGRKNNAWDAVDEAEVAAAVHAATTQNPPLDADEVGFTASGATWALRKATWTQVKAFLKTYFDTVYKATFTSQAVTVSAPLATSQAFSVIGAAAPTLSISAADGSNAGSMSSANFSKLGGVEASADVTDAGNVGSSIVGVAAKTPPIDADTFPCIDSASGNILSKVTWANIKSTLETYLEGVANWVALGMLAKLPHMTIMGNNDDGGSRITITNSPTPAFDGNYNIDGCRQVYTVAGQLKLHIIAGTHYAYLREGDSWAATGKFIAWNFDTNKWCIGQIDSAAVEDTKTDSSLVCPETTWDSASQTVNVATTTPMALTPAQISTMLGLGTAATGTSQSVTVSAPLATSQAFSVIGSAAPTLSIGAASAGAAGSMSSTHFTKLDAISAYGTVYVDAGAMLGCATAGAAAGTNDYGTVEMDYFAFDGGATEERVQFKVIMPNDYDSGTFKAKLHWSSAAGSTAGDTVEWAIKAVCQADDAAIASAFGNPQVVSDTLLASGGTDMQISDATPSITPNGAGIGRLMCFEVYRNTDGTDDMAEDAWLFGVEIQYAKATTAATGW